MKDNKEELHEYLLMFANEETGKIKYADMAADLRNFNFDKETNEGILPKSANSISSGSKSFFGAFALKNTFNEDYLVLDSQQVPSNKLEVIEKQLVKVNRYL